MRVFNNWRRGVAGGSALLCLLVAAVAAQPPPPLPGGAGESATADEPNIRRVYVPTAELDALLKGDRQGVLLPKAEFQRLYEAARAADDAQLNHPSGAIVTAAEYAAEIDDEQLRFTVNVRFMQFDDGWQMLRLPVGGLSLHSALLDGTPAALSRDGKERDTLVVFNDAKGEHKLTLQLTAPLKSVGSDWLAEFATLGSPAGVLTLAVPDGKSLLVDGLKYDRIAETGTDGGYRVALGGRSHVSLRITDRDLRKAADALVFANTAYGLQVVPGELTWSTQTSVHAYGQALSQLSFSVPKELEVAAVESTGLEEWTLGETDRGRRTLITLTFRQPFDGERTVSIRGVLVPDNEEWTVPNLELEDADSHAGVIVVKHGPEVRLQADHGEEVRPIATQNEQRTQQFRTLDPTFDLEFRTLGKERSVQVAMTNLLDVSDDGLDLQMIMDVDTYFVPLFDVRVTLPADFEVTSAFVSDSPAEWTMGTAAAGVNAVRVPLDPPLKPGETRRVSLSAHADPEDWPVERDPVLLPFPEVGLPQANIVEARYGIMADADLDVRPRELTGLDPARQAELQSLTQTAAALSRELRLGFSYQDTLFSGQLEIARRATRLAVSTLALSRLDPQAVRTELRAFVTVDGGGTEGLLIELPESAGTDLRFSVAPILLQQEPNRPPGLPPIVSEPVAIVEQTAADPVDGRRTWALRFDRRMRGNHVIGVSLVEPRAEGEIVTLPVAAFTGADRQNGWVAIEAREEQRLSITATGADGQPLPAVDPIDLPGMGDDVTDRHRIVAGVRYVRLGYSVTVAEESFDAVPVPTALADRLSAVSVLSESGLLQHQLDVTFRAVGMQSLRFVLPAGADLWSVLIDGTPVQVREATGIYQVPLSEIDDPAAARSLRLIYRSHAGQAGATGRLRQSPPLITAVSGSGDVQRLEVLQQEWTLHYPRDVVLLNSRGLFSPSGKLPSDGWLSDAKNAITLPTLSEAGWRIGIAAGIALAIWVVIVAIRQLVLRTWVVIAVGVTLTGMFLCVLLLPSVQQSREAARRTSTSAPASGSVTLSKSEEAGGYGGGVGGGGFTQQFEGEPAADDAAVPESPAMPPIEADMEMKSPAPAEPQSQRPQQSPLQSFDAAGRFSDELATQMAGEAAQQGQQAVIVTDDSLSIQGRAPRARGALLSLSLDLEAPEGSRTQTFDSLASAGGQTMPGLDVSYASRSLREVVTLILAVGLALLMWWLRHATAKTRLAIVLLTIVVPVAFAPITPPVLAMIVEGVFFGGIAGLILWGTMGIVGILARIYEKWCPPGWTGPTSPRTATMLLIAMSSLIGVRFADADEPPAPPGDIPVANAEADLPTIVVPYDEDGPFAAERVYLPQALFRELWLKAYPDQGPKPKAPVDGLVAEALYAVDVSDAEIDDDSLEPSPVRVRARYVLFGFRAEPVWLRLPLDQVAITAATLDNESAVLRPGDKRRPHVLVSKPGLHVLDLEFELSAELRANSGELVLPLFPVPSGSLTLTLPPPEADRDVRVLVAGTPAIASVVSEDNTGKSHIEVAIDQGGPIRVSWQPKATRGGDDNVVHVTSKTAVEVADDGVQMSAEFQLQVRQGLLSEVPFRFPETVRLKRITGPDVGGWQLDGDGDSRTLTIFLRRNVEDETTITAELFVPQEDRNDGFDVAVPPFAPLDVTRETGEVAVLADSHFDVRATSSEGLRQINRDAVALPTANSQPTTAIQLAYRFPSRPWQLSVSVSPRPPQATAVSEHGVSIGHRRVIYGSRMRFDLAGAPRQTMTIAITDDFLLTSVMGEGIEDWFVEDAELVIDFGQPRVGTVEIVLEGHVPRDAADDVATIITPLPLELDRQESVLAVWVEPMYSATLDSFDTWRTIDRAELPDDLKDLHSSESQFAFRSAALEPEIVNLALVRQQPQVTSDAVTLIAVSDVSVDYGLTLRWTIERAATDTLAFTVPAWLENRLELSGPNIRQTTQEVTDDGPVRWTVELTDAVRGPYLLSAVATLPPPDDGRLAAPAVRFEQPPTTPGGESAPIESQQAFAVLVNLSRARLSPADDQGQLTVRREQLPLVLREDLLAQAMAIVRMPQDADVGWTLERLAEQQTQAAQVTAATLTSVLAIDGSLRTLAEYRVRNRGQQFLALVLPERSEVLSVMVKDKPARCLASVIGEQPVSLIPLPQTSAADLSFLVQIVLLNELQEVTRLDGSPLGEHLSIPVPRVIPPSRSREFGVPVVHTSWTVYVPETVDASAINDADQTNVTYQPPPAARSLTELQLYREMADLNRLIEGKDASGAQRLRAANNLKQLQLSLGDVRPDLLQQSGSYEYFSAEDREIEAQKEEILAESIRNTAKTQEELTRAGTMILSDSAVDANEFGRNFILNNNASIATDNFDSGAVIAGEKLKQFRFDSRDADKKIDDAKGKDDLAKPSDSRSRLRGRLESQVPLAANVAEQRSSSQAGQVQQQAPSALGGLRGDVTVEQLEDMNLRTLRENEDGIESALREFSTTLSLVVPTGWSESGGLSLPIELPTSGRMLTFTKLGGDPRLALSIRPRETGNMAVRWLWAIVVFVAGAWLLHQAAHVSTVESSRQGLCVALVAVGLIGLLCLPLPASIVGGALLTLGSLALLLMKTAQPS